MCAIRRIILCLIAAMVALTPNVMAQTDFTKSYAKVVSDYKELKDTYAWKTIHDDFKFLSEVSGYISTAVSLPGYINTASDKLVKAIDATAVPLETASLMGSLRQKAKKILNVLKPWRPKLATIRDKTKTMKQTLEPIKKPIDAFYYTTAAIRLALYGYDDFFFTKYIPCLDEAVAKNPRLQGVQAVVDRTQAQIDNLKPAIRTLYNGVNNGTVYSRVAQKRGNFLDPVAGQMDEVTEKLEKITDPLKELSSAMETEIGYEFPYPDPTLTKPWRTSTYRLAFRVKDIVSGASSIADMIEDKVGGAAYQALQLIGINKVVNYFKDKADDILNAALKKVNLDIDLSLPDLDVTQENLDKLTDHLTHIPSSSLSLKPSNFGGLLRDLTEQEAAVRKSIKEGI